MIIKISGHHVETGQAFQEYIRKKLELEIRKLFTDVISVQVFVEKNSGLFSSEIIVNEGVEHHIIKANGESSDVRVSFDEAMRKMKAQLKKHKQKMIDRVRHHKKESESAKTTKANE